MKVFVTMILLLVATVAVYLMSRDPDSGAHRHSMNASPAEDAPALSAQGGGEIAAEPVLSRIDASPPTQDTMPLAISSAYPSMSLEGALESHFRGIEGRRGWRGDPAEVKPSPGASQVAATKEYNPEGKQLSTEQVRELQSLVESFDARSRPVHANERKATVAALIRAAANGQFESIEIGVRPGMDDITRNRETEEGYRRIKEAQLRLADRLGRDGFDWAWAVAPSTEPDGVPRQNIVYFVHGGEGEVFRLREEERAIALDRRRAYIAFFERIP